MHFTKPAWVMHNEVKNDQSDSKRLPIFSVHVHPDGSRIATGGLDAKIRIWSTKPILNVASEQLGKPPKSLCTLSMHTGPVLTVRWAHSGRWLASGSDDTIVMIWDLDPHARGRAFGSDEVNVEGWKALKRLPGHDSDVTDLAWSPGDRYLASVGLDSLILIWCGYTLERIHRLDQHQGFVKGVCWDPVGQFLATQSDDRSVKIWKTTDWQLEAEVRKPFEDSPGSTFFRRLSWSPDGAHITASNATNNKGFVFIAAVIARNTWTSEISLVGHENTVEVACYNPHIFLRNPNAPVITSNICSVVALGADDRSVSVWQTKSARPLIVAREVFERQIMDLSWSWDGLTLYAVSSDGTLGVFSFDKEELDGIAPHSAQEQYLHKFGFIPPPLPEGYSHYSPPNAVAAQTDTNSLTRTTPPPSPKPPPNAQTSQTGFGHPATINGGGEHVNKLVAKRSNKKRIVPITMNDIPSASTAAFDKTFSSSSSTGAFGSRPSPAPDSSKFRLSSTSNAANDRPLRAYLPDLSSALPNETTDGYSVPIDSMDYTLGTEVPIDSLDTSTVGKGKRKASAADLDDPRPSKPRTLGGDKLREVGVSKVIGIASSSVTDTRRTWSATTAQLIPTPLLLTYLSAKVEGTLEDIFESRNSENFEPTEIMLVSGKTTQWLDYLPSPALHLVATNAYCAVAMQDGSVNIYSPTGRRLMPTMCLGSPAAFMDGTKNALMVVTSAGQLYSWNVKKQSSNFPPVSVTPILDATPNCTIESATLRPNGVPMIHTSDHVIHSYDPLLQTWVKLTELWWAEGSDVWQPRQRHPNTNSSRGIVSSIECKLSSGALLDPAAAEKPRPQWWNTALTLGHLETKMLSAKVLDSAAEFKQALLVYAKKIADEAFRGKAEELIKDLFGPVYWRPGREDSWCPMVMGLPKRELLKEVLGIFVRSKTLTKLALDWQDTLKKASADD